MPLEIIRHDITKMKVDAIVNATNSQLQTGGWVSSAIFNAAGVEALQAECDLLAPCLVGGAVLTKGYQLPATHIIHTAGPIWQGGDHDEEALLASCYRSSLQLAVEHGFQSIAFPLISGGAYGYPKEEALRVAINTIGDFLLNHELEVSLVVYDADAYRISNQLYGEVQAFIDDRYLEKWPRRWQSNAKYSALKNIIAAEPLEINYQEEQRSYRVGEAARSLEDLVDQVGESFSEMLMRLIDESGQTDPAVYNRANLDRRLFSKIRSNADYQPSKNTALALAIALELNIDQTIDLLRRAGYALSPSSKFDLIIEYFIREEQYNIFEINQVLFAFHQALLGAFGHSA